MIEKGEEGGVSVLWFEKLSHTFWLRCVRDKDERELASVHYMEMTSLSNKVEENLDYNCVRWSTFDEMDWSVCGKELEGSSVSVRE